MSFFSSETKNKQEITPYREFDLTRILDQAGQMYATPQEMYPGQMRSGMDPLQSEALGMREQYARGLGGMMDPAMGAWGSMMNAPDVANNPYVQGMLNQQSSLLNRNLQENIMPGIQSGAIGAGQLGSSRQGVAEGIAARGTQEALANQAAQTQFDAYNRGLQSQQFGLGMTPQMLQLGQMPAEALMGVGDVYRAEEQAGINEQVARHQFEQQEPIDRLNRYANMYSAMASPYATTETTQSTDPSLMQKIGQVGGAVSSISGALTGGLSNYFTGGSEAPQGAGMALSGSGMGGGGSAGAPSGFMPMSSFGFQGMGSSGGGGGGGGLGGMIPLAMSFFSDRRLKSNIKHIGHTIGGQNIYSYTKFGHPEIGVMAQESPEDAVSVHPSGYLMVDYSRIK